MRFMLNKESYTKNEVEKIIEFTKIKCKQQYKYHLAGIILRYLKSNPSFIDCYNNRRAYDKAIEFQAHALGQLKPDTDLSQRCEFVELLADFDTKNKDDYNATAVIQKIINYFLEGLM